MTFGRVPEPQKTILFIFGDPRKPQTIQEQSQSTFGKHDLIRPTNLKWKRRGPTNHEDPSNDVFENLEHEVNIFQKT